MQVKKSGGTCAKMVIIFLPRLQHKCFFVLVFVCLYLLIFYKKHIFLLWKVRYYLSPKGSITFLKDYRVTLRWGELLGLFLEFPLLWTGGRGLESDSSGERMGATGRRWGTAPPWMPRPATACPGLAPRSLQRCAPCMDWLGRQTLFSFPGKASFKVPPSSDSSEHTGQTSRTVLPLPLVVWGKAPISLYFAFNI